MARIISQIIGGKNIWSIINGTTFVSFSDFSKIFKFKFVHLGGDEVNTSKLAEICTVQLIYVCYNLFILYYDVRLLDYHSTH